MDTAVELQITRELNTQRDALVEEWFGAVAHTCYIPLTAPALRERLAGLLDRILVLWLSQSPPLEEVERVARDIGADMATLHFVNADALGRTLQFLGTSLPSGARMAMRDAARLHPRLTTLLQGFAAGYYAQGCKIILDEQEQVRAALLAELRAKEAGLRAARDELEARVEQRTLELARANADLRASKERWRSLVESAPDLIGTLDRDGRIRFLNRLPPGVSRAIDTVVGADGPAMAVPAAQEDVRRTLRRVFEEGVSLTQEIAFEADSGAHVWYAISFGPIWHNGEVSEVLFVSRNITQRRRLEEMKDNVIHDVSHELRTPLAKIRMSLEMLSEFSERDDVDRQRMGRVANLAANNIDALIDTLEGILDLSRLEVGMWSYDSHPVVLADLVREVGTFMTAVAEEKGLSMVIDVAPDLPPVAGDRDRLRRVLMNLLDNAVKFSDEGTIRLSAAPGEAGVRVSVADQGEGILPENLDRVFERFFQEKTRSHGVGIGLAICKTLVEAHGGKIWVESPGRGLGATFHVELPPDPARVGA